MAFAAGVYGLSQDSSVQASVDISISCHFCYFTLCNTPLLHPTMIYPEVRSPSPQVYHIP
jgi:hypothetical protein